jgi:hypothetical protein
VRDGYYRHSGPDIRSDDTDNGTDDTDNGSDDTDNGTDDTDNGSDDTHRRHDTYSGWPDTPAWLYSRSDCMFSMFSCLRSGDATL